LRETRGASDSLQKVEMDLSVSSDLINTCMTTFMDYRCEEKCIDYFNAAKTICETHCLSVSMESSSRTVKVNSVLRDSILTEPLCRRSACQLNPTSFRQEVFFPILDAIISELASRFSDASKDLMSGVTALTPCRTEFLNYTILEPFSKHYQSNLDDLQMEVKQMQRMIARKRKTQSMPLSFTTLSHFVTFVEPYHDAFYELHRLSRIALTLPVTSAECERSFSTMKLVKNRTRNSMADERLSNLLLLAIHKERVDTLNLDGVLDRFAVLYPQSRISLI
jgi:hypothetical protein